MDLKMDTVLGQLSPSIIRHLSSNFALLQGDSKQVLSHLPSESVDCVVTSPPYWQLRAYCEDAIEAEIGREPTREEYVSRLCNIFDEVKRILRPTGSCWVNLGDTYLSASETSRGTLHNGIIMHKNLALTPFLFAIEMQQRGWILRNVIIWWKINAKPESVRDRFTTDFEYIFFFVKQAEYWYQQIYEPYSEATYKRYAYPTKNGNKDIRQYGFDPRGPRQIGPGRNARTIWAMSTANVSEQHYATYPEELVNRCITAGCAREVCPQCGQARMPIIEYIDVGRTTSAGKYSNVGEAIQGYLQIKDEGGLHRKLVGYTDCGCGVGFKKGIVLDPFMGSGTTGIVALNNNLNFIGIDISPAYIDIAFRRLKHESHTLPIEWTE